MNAKDTKFFDFLILIFNQLASNRNILLNWKYDFSAIPVLYIVSRISQSNQRMCLQGQPEKASHIILCVVSCILITFSIGSGVALFVTSAHMEGLSGTDGLSLYILIVAGMVSLCSMAAIVFSWKRITWFLHIYQFVCLVLMVSFLLMLLGVVMVDLTKANGGTTDSDCYSPKNYFEFKMLENTNKATALLCSEACPCPKYTQVQQCPTWNPTPYDPIMQKLESQFSCSGWCAKSTKTPYLFSNSTENGQVTGTCHNEWFTWVAKQWKAVVGCISTMLGVLLVNVLFTNWRILKIWNKQEY